MLDRRERTRILGLDATDAAGRPDDVGTFDVRAVRREVADRDWNIAGFDDDAALPVQDAKCLRQTEDVAKGRDVAVAAAALDGRPRSARR